MFSKILGIAFIMSSFAQAQFAPNSDQAQTVPNPYNAPQNYNQMLKYQLQMNEEQMKQLREESQKPGATARQMELQQEWASKELSQGFSIYAGGNCVECAPNPMYYEKMCEQVSADNLSTGFGMGGGTDFYMAPKTPISPKEYSGLYVASLENSKKYYADHCKEVKDSLSWNKFLFNARQTGCMSPCQAARKGANANTVKAECIKLCNSYFYAARGEALGFASGMAACKSDSMPAGGFGVFGKNPLKLAPSGR